MRNLKLQLIDLELQMMYLEEGKGMGVPAKLQEEKKLFKKCMGLNFVITR